MNCYYGDHSNRWYADGSTAEQDCGIEPNTFNFLYHTPDYPKKNSDNAAFQTISYPGPDKNGKYGSYTLRNFT